jgi:hypothetical protein
LGQNLRRNAEQLAQPFVPSLAIQRHQQCAAGVAGIGDVRARQLEHEPAFDRAKGEAPFSRRVGHRRLVIEQPAHLGGREVGIEQQPGLRAHRIFVSGLVQRSA